VVRAFISGGTDPKKPGTNSRVVVFAESPPPMPDELSLQIRVAPWHTDGEWFELTGAKGLSYGFNLAASIVAAEAGFDDALLTGTTGHVLEGPTFSIGWVTDGVFHTPGTDIGILESITRRAVIDAAGRIGVVVREGIYGVDDVMAADEVVAMSTVREVLPVGRVDDRTYPVGPVTRKLSEAFTALVAEELGR
jgi:branched-subunit amino acid aminotransferase/4-amino-4-deoxychorismate lyase